MATGYTVSGRGDLDALFLARVSAKRADVGLRVAGVDLSNRFEPIGAGTPIAATGFRSGGTDLASLFRSISQPLTTHTLTAGRFFQSGFFEWLGFAIGTMGSISPTTYGGVPINQMMDGNDGAGGPTTFSVWLGQAGLPQSFFNSVSINGRVFTSASAGFGTTGSVSMWNWGTAAGLANGGVYPVGMG